MKTGVSPRGRSITMRRGPKEGVGAIIVEITGVDSPRGVTSPQTLTIQDDFYLVGIRNWSRPLMPMGPGSCSNSPT